MRIFPGLIAVAAWAYQAPQAPTPAVVQDLTHQSDVLGATRSYQVVLPPAYKTSQKRYPVIYWFHGYEQSSPQRDAEIGAYVATHEVIVVNLGPVETVGQYPMYFPEIADHVDKTLRTVGDRNHRAVTGFGMGGYMAFWIAARYPDLVSSASSFMGFTEASAGPKDLEEDCNLEDLAANYQGVRTRLVTGSRDFLRFYHQRLNSMWLYSRTGHETENFDSDHGAPEITKTFDFHMHAFADPLPKPAVFTHADAYPNFVVWGWEVVSDRRQPAFTVLENVSAKGFRSAVREWIPGGAAIPEVKLSIASASLYPPLSSHTVTYIRLRDGNLRRAIQKADRQGRLSFDLDGDAYEVGIAVEPVLAATAIDIDGGGWATAGQPVKLRVKFWNKGQARSASSQIQWESADPAVKFESATGRLYGLGAGESATLAVTVTAPADGRAVVKLIAVDGANRMPLELPLFPPAQPATNFLIADGRTLTVYRHATQPAEERLGEGNADAHAAPGETFAVLVPDSAPGAPTDVFRAAEIFTGDSCIDNTVRGSDSWNEYDHAGASMNYSLPKIRPDCPPGHVVHALARVTIPHAPDHQVRYFSLEFPVWYRRGEEPK